MQETTKDYSCTYYSSKSNKIKDEDILSHSKAPEYVDKLAFYIPKVRESKTMWDVLKIAKESGIKLKKLLMIAKVEIVNGKINKLR